MNNNKIIALWGNPDAGKTTVSIKLAKELSTKKKNVIVVFCDVLSPSIMTILPYAKEENKSLGSILSAPEITQEDILSKCFTLEKNPYISLLGYSQGENIFTYASYSKERAVDFLILLRHLADYVIIDCSSVFAYDTLSAVALEMADNVVRLCSSNLKAISYFASYLPLLAGRRFNVDKHIKVLSKVKEKEPKDQIIEMYRGIKYELPYTEEIENQFLSASLFNHLKDKNSLEYENTIRALSNYLIDEKENTKNSISKKNAVEIKSKIKEISLFKKAFVFGKGGTK
ncbi:MULTISPECIES: ParA family protein [unclassified Clostridium]|uniref:ParA family protein n=1 Tax=unclassified Clostridium TaxID=2614128 RepID=UPI00029748CB|nr:MULTISPECIES: ParA family protein [unclassified Clostridium]EKQ55156.1 MAG: ATPase involved in chromosome partitioning [Clostridium sp. Maddingley MBC34-26]